MSEKVWETDKGALRERESERVGEKQHTCQGVDGRMVGAGDGPVKQKCKGVGVACR